MCFTIRLNEILRLLRLSSLGSFKVSASILEAATSHLGLVSDFKRLVSVSPLKNFERLGLRDMGCGSRLRRSRARPWCLYLEVIWVFRSYNLNNFMTFKSLVWNSEVVLYVQEEYREMGLFMSKGQADGWLRPVIGREYPLDQAADAHVEVIEHSKTYMGKIVLNIWLFWWCKSCVILLFSVLNTYLKGCVKSSLIIVLKNYCAIFWCFIFLHSSVLQCRHKA